MSGLTFNNSTPYGQTAQKNFGYSQAVRVGDVVHLSGQGGWKPEQPHDFYLGTKEQIDQAFRNVDSELRAAGVKNGWEAVYKVRSYHIPLNRESENIMVDNFKKWMPNHSPLWTCVGVTRLGEDDMRVEIEVEAYAPKE
ncbi:hypothetical protein KEM56_005102 [Ascosphaera pollenicola]|nr:hypothetical protein KEM56_005102 [Ascosphaera pollenicola]